MDDAPRRKIPWLALTGAVVLLVGVVGLSPLVRHDKADFDPDVDPSFPTWLHLAFSMALGILGLAMIMGSRIQDRPLPRAFVSFAIFTIVVAQISTYGVYLIRSSRPDAFFMFHVIAGLLMQTAVPFLWGTALTRRDQPGDAETQKMGRIGAGLVQVGFIFVFMGELRSFGGYSGMDSGNVLFGLQRIIGLVERVLLLWASIEAVRTCADAEAVRMRALKIHKLMLYWLGVVVVVTALGSAAAPQVLNIWQGLAHLALVPAGTLIVARRYGASYKSAVPAHP